MIGSNQNDGTALSGLDHLRQSIRDILTTPLGSRVMRRSYGSELFKLVDRPYSAETRLALIAATIEALLIWEPRIEVLQVSIESFSPGRVLITLVGNYRPNGQAITLEGIDVS